MMLVTVVVCAVAVTSNARSSQSLRQYGSLFPFALSPISSADSSSSLHDREREMQRARSITQHAQPKPHDAKTSESDLRFNYTLYTFFTFSLSLSNLYSNLYLSHLVPVIAVIVLSNFICGARSLINNSEFLYFVYSAFFYRFYILSSP